MKKLRGIIVIILCAAFLFSGFIMVTRMGNRMSWQDNAIKVPVSTRMTSIGRTLGNKILAYAGRQPVTTAVTIKDGPEVTLSPKGVKATYDIYYFSKEVSGSMDISGHTSRPIAESGYVVVVTSDGFVSSAHKVKYPQDSSNSFVLTYDANGGENAPRAQRGIGELVISEEMPKKEGAKFMGWALMPETTEVQYRPGYYIVLTKDITLYAVWKGAQTPEPTTETTTVVEEPDSKYSGRCGLNNSDEVTWKLNDGVLTLVSKKDNAQLMTGNYPWDEYKDEIKEVRTEGSISEIPAMMFSSYFSLEKVIIGAGTKVIGNSAFFGCSKLTGITLPDNIERIGTYAFVNTGYYNNTKNWSDDGVLYLSDTDEKESQYLINSRLPHTNTKKGQDTSTYTIRDNTKLVADGCFAGNKTLKTITVPGSVKVISKEMFADCSKLEHVILKSGAKTIEEYAFRNCSSLTNVELADSLYTIKDNAFQNCTDIETITLPDECKNIEPKAFAGCAKLQVYGPAVMAIEENCPWGAKGYSLALEKNS